MPDSDTHIPPISLKIEARRDEQETIDASPRSTFQDKPSEHVSDVNNLLKSFEPPNFSQEDEFLKKLRLFHSHVTSVLVSRKRFSIEDFVKEISVSGPFNPEDFGYSSIEHLLFFRGCYQEDTEFVYEKVTAFQRKAVIVAAYLGDFTDIAFISTFKSFFHEKVAMAQHGFDSFESLLKTIRCIRSDDNSSGKATSFENRMGLRAFHKTVDETMENLKRFTREEFVDKLYPKLGEGLTLAFFGYESVEELLVKRGCVFDGKYVYDRVEFYRRMAVVVAKNLGHFTISDFINAVDNEVNSFRLRQAKVFGFQTFPLLFEWMPGVQMVPRDREPVKYTYFPSDEFAQEEGAQLSRKTKEQFAKVLRVARTLKSPFCEKDLHYAYRKYYKVHAFNHNSGVRRVPVFLDTIPGIEHVGDGMYRLDERSTGVEEVELVEILSSDGEAERTDDSGDEEDDNSVVQFVKEETEIVREKRVLVSDTDDSDADGDGVQKKKRPRESPPKSSTNVVGNDARIEHDELVAVALVAEGNHDELITVAKHREDVVSNEDSAPSAESPTATTDTSGANPSPSLYDHILSLGVVRGQWAKDQLSLITGQIEKSIQQQGSIGGIDGPEAVAECKNVPTSEASSSSLISTQSIHQALTNLMGEFNHQFLYHLGVEAIERGVSPAELGKKIMDDFFGKKNQP